ncbi:MAG: Cytochrome c [Myxococcales bacterium]|nr:Cytochrome c [Myxococcales bacterium]
MRRALKSLVIGLAVVLGLFLLMQAIPYGRTHSNPPTISEPKWDSPRTRELAVRACFDCHSNHTKWPWYADVAPFSWVVQYDVENARSVVNYSEWNRHYPLAVYSGQTVRDEMMPPDKYKIAHPEANLTPQEAIDLQRGLDATMGPETQRP